MAQNISLMGATYSAVPAVTLLKQGGGTATFTDVTDTTAAAADVASGKYFYTAAGVKTLGTASGGGGGSSYTHIISKTTGTISTSSTSASTVETWDTGHPEIWTSNKIVYVCITDTHGPRNNYFYCTNNYFFIPVPKNGGTATSSTDGVRSIIRKTSDGNFAVWGQNSSSGYGVFADTIYSDGRIRIRKRYNSTYSLTVSSTYTYDVYLLDMASNVTPFG